MDQATGSGLALEYELMKQQKYRVYISNIDKALKNFEGSCSEWADLISALGKLNKVCRPFEMSLTPLIIITAGVNEVSDNCYF